MEKEEKLELERHKAGLQMCIEMNKLASEFSARALRGAFLLNGGAATAILATKNMEFAGYACWYGLGAFLAVAATAMAYMTSCDVVSSWQEYFSKSNEAELHGKIEQHRAHLQWAAAGGVLSGAIFLAATVSLWASL